MSFKIKIGRTLVRILFFLPLIFINSCLYRKPVNIVLLNKNIILSQKPTVIECSKPLRIMRNSVSLQLKPLSNFSLVKNRDRLGINFDNEEKVFLNVIVTDNSGKQYSNNTGGKYGRHFAVYFSDLPKNSKIIKIEITASKKMECKEICWYGYDPI